MATIEDNTKKKMSPEQINAYVKRVIREIDSENININLSYYSCSFVAFINTLFDPVVLLASAIRECKNISSLYLVGLFLRLVDDPNVYFNTKVGPMHILAYITYIFDKLEKKDIGLYNTLVLMCLANGASYEFDFNEQLTVREYIEEMGYDIIDYQAMKRTELCQLIYIWLDKPELCATIPLNPNTDYEKYIFIVIGLSQQCVRKLNLDMQVLLNMSIASGNVYIFKEILSKQQTKNALVASISYSSINNLCQSVYLSNRDYNYRLSILRDCLKAQIKLDMYQVNLIEFQKAEMRTEFIKEFNINNRKTDQIVTKVLNRLILHGATKAQIQASIPTLVAKLTELGVNLEGNDLLTPEHQFVTVMMEIDALPQDERKKYQILHEFITMGTLRRRLARFTTV